MKEYNATDKEGNTTVGSIASKKSAVTMMCSS
jgi:hypothetical protein